MNKLGIKSIDAVCKELDLKGSQIIKAQKGLDCLKQSNSIIPYEKFQGIDSNHAKL